VATAIIESGCVELSLKPKTDILNNDKKYVNGHFILLRASNEDNYNSWYRLTDFTLASWDSSMDKFLCRDYSIAQGATYKYALQAYNTRGIHSRRFEANDIFVDFEDMFLSDGKRQLCLKYNPKVSSFKNTILESKMDTIGGRYPFFFRNGNVHYKEFPISGLISLMMDENKDFLEGMNIIDNINHEDPYGVVENAIFLTSENFFKEREFKNKVLEWLTNGEPKLFRSPGEGNFIVRLMNTSLTPNDTLSRMIHSFSCTAYEVEEYTFDNLRKYGMIMDNSIEVRELEYK
jgi:hypothetical protein